MKKITKAMLMSALLGGALSVSAKEETVVKNYETRIGQLQFENDFENGIPTAKTSKMLFNEIECQAF